MKFLVFILILISVSCSIIGRNFRSISSEQRSSDIDCSENTSKITAVDSPNYNHFKALLAKGENASLKEFLRFWYPFENKSEDTLTYFFDCQMRPWSPLIYMNGYDEKGQLTSACSPDVLYSWGPKIKIDSMTSTLRNDDRWVGSANPPKKTLYMALTPFSTYAYGDYQVRLKMKPNTIFETRDCHELPGTVCVRTAMFQEFNIDDAGVIESWSFGTPEQYDEIVRDILRVSSGKRAQGYYTREPRGHGMNRLFGNLADGVNDSEKKLKENLLEHIRMIINEEGQIRFYSGSCQNRKRHFSTTKPTYFNPN